MRGCPIMWQDPNQLQGDALDVSVVALFLGFLNELSDAGNGMSTQ